MNKREKERDRSGVSERVRLHGKAIHSPTVVSGFCTPRPAINVNFDLAVSREITWQHSDNVQRREEQARQGGELLNMQLARYDLGQRMYSLTYCQRRIQSWAKLSTKVETAQLKVNYNARYNNTVFCLRTEPHKGNNVAQRMRSLTRSQRSIHSEASLFPE